MAKSSTRGNGARRGSSIFSGLLIGLALGLALAVGVALWVSGNNPFASSDKAADTSARIVPPAAAPAAPEAAPDFDFYKVLPEDARGAPDRTPTAERPPRYFLQAGAFQNASDADNLKAQLALLGVEAQVQTGELAEKGMIHRVRIGPFEAMDAVNSTRALLAQNNIAATLVKEPPLPSGD